MRADSPLYTSGARRRSRSASTPVVFGLVVGVVAALALLVGLAFAGSRQELAEGTHVAGVDVGGMTRGQAVAELQRRFEALAAKPVTFTVAGTKVSYAANQLGVEPDWRAAVSAAARAGDGFGPIRGFRRLHTRVFGAEVLPRVGVSNAALEFALDKIGAKVNQAPVSAAVVRKGLSIEIEPARVGRRLEREGAAEVVVRALGSLDRGQVSGSLPVVTERPRVTAPMLAPAARRARIAVSEPVQLRGAGWSWRLPRWRVAELLALPSDGHTRLRIAGPKADAYFRTLAERVGKAPRDATFAVSGDGVQVVPSQPGRELNVTATARALLRAAVSPANRVASLSVVSAKPDRTTAEALAMGIDRRMASYKTYYSGTADRITNLRLGVTYLDGTLVAPGGTFSLNSAIGERTAERGFRPAPVIIGNKYAEEIGGGTSQVATTAFNAAWEAGLKITERNPHSLYISRYQLGRDATVYWPSLDLKFANDTSKWILVKGSVEGDGISISIYGGETRRVESSAGSRTITGAAPIKRIKDKTLEKGKTVVEEEGAAPSRTTVTRTIYTADGELLRTETWNTTYKGETRIVRVGTKVKEKPPAKPGDQEAPAGETAKAHPDEGATTSPGTKPPAQPPTQP